MATKPNLIIYKFKAITLTLLLFVSITSLFNTKIFASESSFSGTNLHSFNDSISLAKKAPDGTVVTLIGKLIVVDKKYFLEDSTAKIELNFSKDELKRVPSKVGQNIIIAGKIIKGFWYSTGFKEVVIKVIKIEIYQGVL